MKSGTGRGRLSFVRHPAAGLVVAGLALMLTLTGCSRKVLSVLFDVPERAARPANGTEPSSTVGPGPPRERPPIEDTLDPEVAMSLLPRDHAGNIDWMEALRRGDVNPRSRIPDGRDEPDDEEFRFGYDFYYPNPVPTFDAYFPHSSHTEWVDCRQCHPRIFPHRGTPVTMEDIVAGEYCGECHGKVSFPIDTGCERCHPAYPQPPNRAVPEFLGTIRMKRTETESAFSDSLLAGQAGLTEVFPEATFPHWIHRARFECKVCHMEIFEPKAGANHITMKDIAEGRFCGECHDGKTAFSYTFGNCARCHQEPSGNLATQ